MAGSTPSVRSMRDEGQGPCRLWGRQCLPERQNMGFAVRSEFKCWLPFYWPCDLILVILSINLICKIG